MKFAILILLLFSLVSFTASADSGLLFYETVGTDFENTVYGNNIDKIRVFTYIDTKLTNTEISLTNNGDACFPVYEIDKAKEQLELPFYCEADTENTIALSATKELENVFAEYTFIKSPEKVSVFGTEYVFGDEGRTFLQILDNGIPINNATCFVTIFRPDNSIWVNNGLMTHQTGSNGMYYFDFTVENTTGVYMIDAICNYLTSEIIIFPFSEEVKTGTIISGTIDDLNESDNIRHVIEEEGGGSSISPTYDALFHFPFDETSGTFAQNELSDLDGVYNGAPDLNDPFIRNTGIIFDGANDYVFHNNSQTVASNEEIAMCFGFREINAFDNDRVVDWLGATGVSIEDDTDEIRFTVDRSVSGADFVKSTTKFQNEHPFNLCFFDTLGTLEIWINGTLDKSDADLTSGTITFPPDSTIGVNDAFTQFFEGELDDFCYFKGTDINVSQVANLYHTDGCAAFTTDDNASIDLIYNFTGVDETHDEYDLIIEYQWTDTTDPLNFSIFNFTSMQFQLLGTLPFAAVDSTIAFMLDNISDFIDGTTVEIEIIDNKANTTQTLSIDKLIFLELDDIETPIDTVRGGGEIHVSEGLGDVVVNINTSIIDELTAQLLAVNQSIQNNEDANTAEILATILNINISLANHILDLNVSLQNTLFNSLAQINQNTNASVLASQQTILNQLNANVSDILNQILATENTISININNSEFALNNSLQIALAEILLNITNAQASIESNIANANSAIITYINSQHAILNGTLSVLKSMIQDQISDINTSIQYNDDNNTQTIIDVLSININNSQSVLVGAIGNDTTIIENLINQQTAILNTSITNTETTILNEINLAAIGLNMSIDEQTATLLAAIGNDTDQIMQNDNFNANEIMKLINASQVIVLNNITVTLNDSFSVVGNDTQSILDSITSTEFNINVSVADALATILAVNNTQIILDHVDVVNNSIITHVNFSINTNTQTVLNELNALNLSLGDFFMNFIGNDTPQLLSAIGNDTQFIIDTLNNDFGNDSQFIIDSILQNTTLDIDASVMETMLKLQSMNDSLRALIISEINDVQGDLVSEINDVQSDISTQTTTITSSIVTNANILLSNQNNNTAAILAAIQAHNDSVFTLNVTVDTFSIAADVWNFTERTLTEFLFNVTLENVTVELDQNTTNFITGAVPAEFEVGACFANSNTSILLGVFIIVAMLMILIGFTVAWIGVFGSLSLMILSWYIAGCIGMIGYVVAALGIVGIIFFVTRRQD